MIWDGSRERGTEALVDRRSSRRALFARSIKVVGAAALVAGGVLGPARVSAQDDGLGAGGRTGGDSGNAEAGSTLPAVQEQGLGTGGRQGGDDADGGRRRRQDDADALDGVGAGGRTDAPMVMEMPDTGVGIEDRGIAPVLLAAGAVGAAALAIRTREASTSSTA